MSDIIPPELTPEQWRAGAARVDAAIGTPPEAEQAFQALQARIDLVKRAEASAGMARTPVEDWGQKGRFVSRTLRNGTDPRSRSPRGVPFSKQTLRQRATYWISFAGAILLGVIGVSLFSHFVPRPSQNLPVRSYTTVVRQRARVTLADGSRALLWPATTLTVTTQPSHAGIDVQVVGQALFTVAHSQDRLFRVRAGNAVARVLGTTFMIRQYTTDAVVRVVVTEGRVSLSSDREAASRGSGRVLLAHMMGMVDDSGNVQVMPNVNVEDYTAWTTERIVFNKTPARDAVVELSRVYGVDIRIADSTLANQQLTWTIPVAQRSLSVVLVSLVGLLDAHTVQTGRIITLVPGRSASRRPVRPFIPSTSERQYGK